MSFFFFLRGWLVFPRTVVAMPANNTNISICFNKIEINKYNTF